MLPVQFTLKYFVSDYKEISVQINIDKTTVMSTFRKWVHLITKVLLPTIFF